MRFESESREWGARLRDDDDASRDGGRGMGKQARGREDGGRLGAEEVGGARRVNRSSWPPGGSLQPPLLVRQPRRHLGLSGAILSMCVAWAVDGGGSAKS